MPTQDLIEFFKAKRAQGGPANLNWEQRKSEWIENLHGLHKQVTTWLQPAIDAGTVVPDYRSTSITEEFMGAYDAPELALVVGDETVVFSPKARNIVGGSGRVDLRGEMGEVTLVLQPDTRWSVVKQRTPTLRVVPLDQDSLLDALRDVMRP
jgi:hypothetical protein